MSVTAEKITLKSGSRLVVTKAVSEETVTVSLAMEEGKNCLLHWGVIRPGSRDWRPPAQHVWPKGTKPFDNKAVRTPFVHQNGAGSICIRIDRSEGIVSMPFALYFPQEDRWDNNKGRNYKIDMPRIEKEQTALTPIPQEVGSHPSFWEHLYPLGNGAQILATTHDEEDRHRVTVLTNLPGTLMLHWGVATRERQQWQVPPPAIRPKDTKIVGGKAAQTPFYDDGTLRKIQLVIPKAKAPLGIPFVVKDPDANHWFNDGGRNFYIPLAVPKTYKDALGTPILSDLADVIVEREMGHHGWTLMHRCNLCHDLVDRVRDNEEGWAMIFVWQRFSALRQLDWQRNYNTQPRELAHALDRLTRKLALCYSEQPVSRDFIRLMLTGLGRGGEGQRVRDEILHIMHRHHIKEVAGHFMEEWHQKLHNNTTPDDVVICEAYLAFLKHDGDLGLFYDTLKRGGVSKERLRNYDRPIRSDPDFIPHLKDALLHDFWQFLQILKGVHTGTDLDVAVQAAAPFLGWEIKEVVERIRGLRNEGLPLIPLAEKIAEARKWFFAQLDRSSDALRDLLFLDLALEDFLRVAIEQKLHTLETLDTLIPLVGPVMENLLFSCQDDELPLCLRHWQALSEQTSRGTEWALEAKALFERTERIIGAIIDRYYGILQPKAELLGKAFQAEPWTITLFSEEVARGRPVFALSALLKKIDPILRQKAKLGDWQVISSGQATGVVKKAAKLKTVQNETFQAPTIIITSQVSGEEELPEQIKGVITSDTVDIVSHVAIRARNTPIVFATCYDEDKVSKLESLAGQWIEIKTTDHGDVVFEKASPAESSSKSLPDSARKAGKAGKVSLTRPSFSAYALPAEAFNAQNVGAKSNNLNALRGKLPPWIALPSAAAIPFSVFEKTLSDAINQDTAKVYASLVSHIDQKPAQARPKILEEIRQAVLELAAPGDLRQDLEKVAETASLPWPAGSQSGWDASWMCIKKVWASKWNERATLSRRTVGIPDQDLFMAVLIQKVVEAEYAFVIHTVNPVSGSENELYAEIVPGLGETLVGNYPGRAFSFCCDKNSVKNPRILSFPSKSVGLFGKGLIFRSDSNGEDLSSYAGAGLYDSVTFEAPSRVLLAYAQDRLVQDRAFRTELFTKIAQIGWEIEKALGTPQDIEGAYSDGKYYVVQTRPQVGVR